MEDPKIIAAVIGGIAGIIGGTIPGIGYLIMRKIERKKGSENLELIQKTIDIEEKLKNNSSHLVLKTEKILKKNLGIEDFDLYIDIKSKKNIDEIFSEASENIDENVQYDKLNEGWYFDFIDNAKNISDSSVQKIWGKILSGEIKKPGSYSLRTLNILKNLSKTEATIFNKAISLSCLNEYIVLVDRSVNGLKEFGLSYDDIIILREAGLISYGDEDYKEYTASGQTMFTFMGKNIIFNPDKNGKIKLNILHFSNTGRELLNIVDVKVTDKYIDKIIEHYGEKGYKGIKA